MQKTLQISIAEPCHENWQQMTPNEQGRFCGSCQKTVVDFTSMTDQEILNFISSSGHNICGRVNNDQMNRDMNEVVHKRRFTWAYVWNVVLAGFLVTKAEAQVKRVKPKTVTMAVEKEVFVGMIATPRPMYATAKGIVANATDNTPIAGATVSIKGSDIGTASDSAGAFKLKVALQQPVELVVSSIGFETKTMVIDNLTDIRNLTIELKPEALTMDSVSVVAFDSFSCTRKMGGVGYSIRVSRYEKVQRTLSDILPKKDVKVYPNPTMRGTALNISLALKQPGQYRLELMDASGRVLHAEVLQMAETTRNLQIPTHTTWSAGVYWLRITGQHTKNVYQNKVIIQ